MKVLVTGAGGMLGRDLTGLLGKRHQVTGVDVADFDLTDRQATMDALAAVAPDVVIHCAAYTDVEKAETDCDMAFAVNAAGSEYIARACRETGARLYLVSTDFVFDGAKGVPYVETDIPNPLSQYGRSKFEGEIRARRVLGERLSVVRTAWLYGAAGESFLTKLVRLTRGRSMLKVVDDQRGSPTWTVELAGCLERLVDSGAGRPVYHAACAGECSRYELAVEWFKLLEIESVRLEPVGSAQFPSSVQRPVNSAMASENLERDGIEPPAPWREALAKFAGSGGRKIAAKLMED